MEPGEFGLDLEFVAADRDFHANAGMLAREQASHTEQPERRVECCVTAATNFRRAAAHCLLLGDRGRARELFNMAAAAYFNAGLPYGIMMQILAGSNPNRIYPDTVDRTAHQIVYPLLVDAAYGINSVAEMRDRMALMRSVPLGVLGLPLGDYYDLAAALISGEGVPHAVSPFVNAYNMALRRSREDRYHWERLAMPFHPVEPDILAVLRCVSRKFGIDEAPWQLRQLLND